MEKKVLIILSLVLILLVSIGFFIYSNILITSSNSNLSGSKIPNVSNLIIENISGSANLSGYGENSIISGDLENGTGISTTAVITGAALEFEKSKKELLSESTLDKIDSDMKSKYETNIIGDEKYKLHSFDLTKIKAIGDFVYEDCPIAKVSSFKSVSEISSYCYALDSKTISLDATEKGYKIRIDSYSQSGFQDFEYNTDALAYIKQYQYKIFKDIYAKYMLFLKGDLELSTHDLTDNLFLKEFDDYNDYVFPSNASFVSNGKGKIVGIGYYVLVGSYGKYVLNYDLRSFSFDGNELLDIKIAFPDIIVHDGSKISGAIKQLESNKSFLTLVKGLSALVGSVNK